MAKRLADAMGVVQHAGDSSKAKAIKSVLLDPPPEVGQQKAQDLVLAVVEQRGAPLLLLALASAMRVAVVGTIHGSEAIHLVRRAVRMHQVHNHRQAVGVGRVHQILELVRRAQSACWGEEVGDMVTIGAVPSMLCNCHDLQSIVAETFDAGQDLLEFQVRVNSLLFSCDAWMGFVDLQVLWARRPCMSHHIARRGRWLPHHAVEDVHVRILPCQLRPSRHTLHFAELGLYSQTDFTPVGHCPFAVTLVGQIDAPTPKLTWSKRMSIVPVVEIADQVHLPRCRQPFCEGPLVLRLMPLKSKGLVSLGELLDATFARPELFLPATEGVDSVHDVGFMRTQLRILLEN
mmetsp:Transcript_29820/g.71003  ORF Transcript_29820/g.71003 Transcript_29820/m.71003 type:complete len:346 (+) Transcript_29820:5541-6578(+)